MRFLLTAIIAFFISLLIIITFLLFSISKDIHKGVAIMESVYIQLEE